MVNKMGQRGWYMEVRYYCIFYRPLWYLLLSPWYWQHARRGWTVCAEVNLASVGAAQELIRNVLGFLGVFKTATRRFLQAYISYLSIFELTRRGDVTWRDVTWLDISGLVWFGLVIMDDNGTTMARQVYYIIRNTYMSARKGRHKLQIK